MKISIITISYNSASTIRETLQSVAAQQHANIEHIIIDGGSGDETVSIVQEFKHISTCISEKDEGLYDAMNKGLRLATGDVIGILNSDDLYADSTILQQVNDAFQSTAVDCVYGDLQYVDQHNTAKVIRSWKAGKFNHRNFLYGWMPPHPTFFVRKAVYEKVGYFNTTLKSAADYEMMLRILYSHHHLPAYIPEVLVKMRTGGVSNASLRNRLRANREDARAWKLNNKRPHFFTVYLKPLRKLPQYLVR